MTFNEGAGKKAHLRVFDDKSEYHSRDGKVETFNEGVISRSAKVRTKKIRDAFESGFLDELITGFLEGKISIDAEQISERALESVRGLVDSLTSEVGRALIGLAVMQLCIKSIHPEQNIRLHKGGVNRASFSWVEGISMRTLDKQHVTPTLRKHNLLKLNADGFMMTRSLAENYPYTILYKARLRGAREQWLVLVEELEIGNTSPIETLKQLLSHLINAALDFDGAAEELLESSTKVFPRISDRSAVISLLKQHADDSGYAARLLEIGMHSLMQTAVEAGAFGFAKVKPLSQMRSANKKHGNIGDVELLEDGEIVQSWDAKFGKGYLREELEEVVDKLQDHDDVELVGFVTDSEIERTDEISVRIDEVRQSYGVEIVISSFKDWVDQVYETTLENTTTTEEELSQRWLVTYCEYLCQKRRANAPIDEPCFDWVLSLSKVLNHLYR